MSTNRKQYTQEFKIEAVGLTHQPGMSLAQVARDLGLNEGMLGRWKKELEGHKSQAFPGQGRAHDAELRRLQREVEVLRQERDILKKAISIFSHPTGGQLRP
jgi:transposase